MQRNIVLAFAMLLLAAAKAASAAEVVEAYRSPFGRVNSLSVNHADGSCWVAGANWVTHVASDGRILSQPRGLTEAQSIAVNPTDGSCWVLEFNFFDYRQRVIHLSEDGRELLRLTGLGRGGALSVNPTDGSVWVGTWGDEMIDGELIHLSETGGELLRVGRLGAVGVVSVNPGDGSVWVVTGDDEVIHLTETGTELLRLGGSGDWIGAGLAVNPADSSCWVSAFDEQTWWGLVIHLAEDGTELCRVGGFAAVESLSVNPTDGSCWVADFDAWARSGKLVHLAEEGAELWRRVSDLPRAVSVNPTDGSCWVGNGSVERRVVRLAEDGTELWSAGGFSDLRDLCINPADGSCWVAGGNWYLAPGQVVHLAGDGAELYRRVDIGEPLAMSVYPEDGSCWVSRLYAGPYGLIHLAEDGTELARVAEFVTLFALNPVDGSVWAAAGDAIHLSETGAELLRVRLSGWALPFAVNPLDSSCWIVDAYGDGMVHLAEDGTELLRLGAYDDIGGPSVDPHDGSCWLTLSYYEDGAWRSEVFHLSQHDEEIARLDRPGWVGSPAAVQADHSCWFLELEPSTGDGAPHYAVVHVAHDGEELARVSGFPGQSTSSSHHLWADPGDGSCWVAVYDSAYDESELVLLAADGTELWRGAGMTPSALSVDPVDGSCWVVMSQQVVHLVRTDRLAFPDIGVHHWARREISACADSDIVSGDPDGLYHPEWSVTRDQMAVYIGRALAGGDENVPEFTGTPSFPDVPEGFWALKYVEYALSQNVVEGYEDGLYHPEYEVTRDQMAVYVARALVAPTGEAALADYVPADPRNFPDVPSDFWAYRHIEYCVEKGVAAGYLDGLYHPEIVVTRDQMAVYVARAFGLL